MAIQRARAARLDLDWVGTRFRLRGATTRQVSGSVTFVQEPVQGSAGLREDIYRGNMGNARQRVPTTSKAPLDVASLQRRMEWLAFPHLPSPISHLRPILRGPVPPSTVPPSEMANLLRINTVLSSDPDLLIHHGILQLSD
jgi:hypothetical protein